MTPSETLRLIKKLSNRRHKRMVSRAKLKRFPNANREEIARYSAFIDQLGREIDALFQKL